MTPLQLHKEYYPKIEVYEEDNEVVKALADNISLPSGWDNIPTGKYSAVAVAYRGNDIWYFEHKRFENVEDEDEGDLMGRESVVYGYRAVKFPDRHKHEYMAAYANSFINIQNLKPRFIMQDQDGDVYIPNLNSN